jgi:hypothetical protein
MSPFEFVDSIMVTKIDLMDADPNCEKEYVPFIVNRHLSYFPDTVLYADDLNRSTGLDKKMQYDYLLNSIRPQKKRFVKWHKPESSSDLEAIAEYFDFSMQKAKEAQKILSKDQVNEIRKKLIKGGVNK